MPPVIEIHDLYKGFTLRSWRSLLRGRGPVRVEALRGVSLEVGAGEILGLLGPNGAGKTTLIKILATLVAADAGAVRIAGYDLQHEAHRIRRCIGLVNTNERSFYWRLTGRQNLRFFACLYNLDGPTLEQQVDRLLALVGLDEKADTPFMGWSTGQRQRLAIARALLSDAQVLLFDEPTSSLDPVASSGLIEFVKSDLVVRDGKTVIWCTHDLTEAEQISDRLAILHKGRVLHCGPLSELQQRLSPGRRYLLETGPAPEDLLAEMGLVGQLLRSEGDRKVFELDIGEADIPVLLSRLQAASVDVYACSPREVELEGLFSRMIGEA